MQTYQHKTQIKNMTRTDNTLILFMAAIHVDDGSNQTFFS